MNFYRSWTGLGIYRVKLAKVVAGYDVVEAICEAKMLVNKTPEEQAEMLKFLVGNLLLGRELPFPNPHNVAPEYPGLYQHAIVGTGYPEKKG